MEHFSAFTSDTWKGYCANSWRELFRQLDTWLASNPGEMVVHHACRDVRRILTPKGVIYLKYIRALTDSGLTRQDLFSYLKWVLRPSRAIGAWKASVAMDASGLACPVPILAARKRVKGIPEDIIVTTEVPYPDCFHNLPGEDAGQVGRVVAHAAALLHGQGFVHGDFILQNICLDTSSGKVVYLDNDRSWKPPFFVRRHYQRRNLAQMAYSMSRTYRDLTSAKLFLEAYAQEAGWPSETDRLRLLRIVRKRYNRDKRRPPLEL